ncbi:MAG: hypothetical protein K5908_08115 [Erysipelotrichaceae bacterium]|jgi:hypothetical protein|nr:hypothetical protein [Erysipelotrichaceae bacterium]
MPDKKIDMFKLVEQVEKQKKMDIDDIFSTLDSVKDEEDRREEVKVHTYTSTSDPSLVSRPRIPDKLGAFDTRFECFRCIIENVSYGTKNVNAYVEGHKDALEKYYGDAYQNSKDLYVIEARVNDELNKYNSHSALYDKGYYDGLAYVLKALKRSKELLMQRISAEMIRKL